MKHVIIGGVAGGATAAARIRRADEGAEIILLEKGKYISYANCGLPYYIGGVIEERSSLFLQTPQSFGKRFRVDVRVENEVVSIEPSSKSVKIRRGDGSEYSESYDKLLLSPGAVPVRPPLEGIDLDGIFTLRDVRDTDRIKNYINSHRIKNAVVVGAGFIGLEMAENLQHAGADVSIVEMGNQVMAPVDFSMASPVHQHLLQKGVHLHLQQSVAGFSKEGERMLVKFNSGQTIHADIVILSIGVRPEISLAKSAGLKIGETGGIYVDDYLETSEKDIYAVGDAIEFPHPITGKPWLNYLANPANRQGRIVADNMVLGNVTRYEGAIGTSIAKVFDMTVASTGLAGKKLKQLGIPYRASWTHSGSNAGYYPDALPLSLKLTFDPITGKLYGGQCVGYKGVDKRIDQIALLIKKGGTIYDLIEVEHTYAPPFSSAKDPIAIAGYVASNIVNGQMPVISWREMQTADPHDVFLLDVRTEQEFSMGTIAGSVNIPLDDLRERIKEVPKDRPVYLFCAIGLRGYLALKILTANGFTQVKNLSGGYKTYSSAVAPLEQTKTVSRTEQIMPNSDQQTHVDVKKVVKVNACGLQCPGPILRLKQSIDSVEEGEQVEIVATDAGFSRDAQSWCNSTGNRLMSTKEDKGKFTVIIEKGAAPTCRPVDSCEGKGKTFIMFSDDLDKALATFVLANGAAATGKKVTIFFTFWGLNVIKKTKKPTVEKDIFGRMFGMMLPSSSLNLKLSKMNMFGMGSRMMRLIMKRKHIESLESLRSQAIEQGVEFIACQMSMDVMGVKKEELLEDVTVGGVATYMERADNANVNLFI
ncbi:MAG: FAD-dependent oxidoreductase [Dysgonamonadaceae bacterium]